MKINEIYRINNKETNSNYVGTVRNEKRFNIDDDVFVAVEDKLFHTKIVGIENLPTENPEYKYKVVVPNGMTNEFNIDDFDKRLNSEWSKDVSITCQYIFKSIEEAKESMIKNAEEKFDLELKNIEKFFKQFE